MEYENLSHYCKIILERLSDIHRTRNGLQSNLAESDNNLIIDKLKEDERKLHFEIEDALTLLKNNGFS